MLVQAPQPNAGRKKKKKNHKNQLFSLVKQIKIILKKYLLDIPASYAKIWGETNFWEFPRSGWKAEGAEKEKGRKK